MNASSTLHPVVNQVTDDIIKRSSDSRRQYLDRLDRAVGDGRQRTHLSCGNLAHGFAACQLQDKEALAGEQLANIAIISSYNDMLSAHQPFQDFPAIIKEAIRKAGGVAQFAGGTPAMCDGVTQGQDGMELSLFSRDTIAMATAVALSHNMFDGMLLLGVCDKIVPGLLIGALHFGHLPALFVPAGPMPSGLPNKEKQRIRQLYAKGEIDEKELLKAESASYHSPGTCTFYGTANSNQLMMELMGLHLPGASFVNPNTGLRDALTAAAGQQILKFTASQEDFRPVGRIVDARAIVNAIVGLLATGGSTNHTIHLVAIARAAGLQINWNDFHHLSSAVPLLARIYPNGDADINHFQEAGGMSALIHALLEGGLIHADIVTMGDSHGMQQYTTTPVLDSGKLHWRSGPLQSSNKEVLRDCNSPFDATGGLHLLDGNLGRAVIKVSSVKPEHWCVEAPAVVFDEQEDMLDAYKAGELEKDFIAVIRNQGPQANGMPELHKLTPTLGVLQDKGFKVALCTDGRMSGASGKVPAAIHVTPECRKGGMLALVQNGDMIRLDAAAGTLDLLVDEDSLNKRIALSNSGRDHKQGCGRELFSTFRQHVSSAEEGATIF